MNSRICSKSCSDGICSDRIQFLTGIKPSKLESGISRILCTRKLDTTIQEFGAKALENEFVACHALETEFTFWLESNLQSSNLTSPESYAQENLTQWFKSLVQKRSKMNLQCVMVSKQNSLFDCNQTFRPNLASPESYGDRSNFLTQKPLLKTNLHSSKSGISRVA